MNGAATPLLLLPGLLNDARVFAPQRAMLERAAITVPELWHDDSIAAMAERALRAAPAEFALAGFSMGGYVALEIMRRAPERVMRLALIDTSARVDSDAGRRRREALIGQTAQGRWRGITSRLLPLLIHADRLEDRALVATLEDMAMAVGRDGFVNQQRAILDRRDSRETLATIKVPTLVLCGRDDQVTPYDHSEEIADRVVGARLIGLERCGHVAPLERPEAVSAALNDWLAGRD